MATDTLTLEDVAHAQSHQLTSVLVLLKVAFAKAGEAEEDDVCRLVDMAIDKVTAVQSAFDPYI